MLHHVSHRWPSLFVCALAGLLLIGSAGCAAKAQARTPTDRPPLDAPPPPPHVITSAPAEAATESVEKPAAGAPGPTTARPPSTARSGGATTPRPDAKDVKPETAKPEPVAERVEPPRPEPAVGLLQTTPPGNQAEAEKAIRALLTTTGQSLARVDYRALKPDARAQYDTAKRFMQQAEDAVKVKDFPFALKLADKAAELARSLPVR
ncbi:MAG: hypothetical protein HYS05_13980 [Acidobacteria bacterium]|nr:hypothetical protein [Acidobacteriota bacterium]